MKNVKISLLAAGATLALLACSSLEVDNPAEENFPKDWSVSEYIKVNPDLRALQIRDQVNILNVSREAETTDPFFEEGVITELGKTVALNYAGLTQNELDNADPASLQKFLANFNVYGVDNEPALFDTLTLDTSVFEQQYVAYGVIEGRPYRLCKDNETQLVKKGDCQADTLASVGFVGHLYCANAGVTYCIDCESTDECIEPVIDEPESSSSAKPESSDAAGDESSSSEGGEPAADSSSSEGGEPATDSSSSEETAAESSSSAE